MDEFVLDCSVTMTWCFREEATPATDQLLAGLEGDACAHVPAIWSLEVINVLLVSERTGRVGKGGASRFLALLDILPIHRDQEASPSLAGSILSIGRAYGLSAYDASYVELCVRKGLPIATLDTRMEMVAKKLNVPSCL